jgi:hypothetical protein
MKTKTNLQFNFNGVSSKDVEVINSITDTLSQDHSKYRSTVIGYLKSAGFSHRRITEITSLPSNETGSASKACNDAYLEHRLEHSKMSKLYMLIDESLVQEHEGRVSENVRTHKVSALQNKIGSIFEAIAQQVEAGAITQEQADAILNGAK